MIKPIFECIELHLKEMLGPKSDLQVVNRKDQSCGELIRCITSEIAKCHTIQAHLITIKEAAADLAKKIKILEKKETVKEETANEELKCLIDETVQAKLEKQKKKHRKKKKDKKRKSRS
jgi:hypothetical protein